MKKIQAMMAVVLVALMAFAVQSCGSDDKTPDLSGDTYKLTTSMTFQDKGQLTDAEAAVLQQAFVKTETGQYITDKSAADKTKEIVDVMAANIEVQMKGDTSVAFTVTVITTNMNTNKQVCKWDIVYDKGTTTTKKY
ncbi:MAG: hypothetical protein II404_04815 [Prevotella sp.]|nr:hypothetical protein [Prevotella sp.]